MLLDCQVRKATPGASGGSGGVSAPADADLIRFARPSEQKVPPGFGWDSTSYNRILQLFNFRQPDACGGIAGHTPVAAGAHADIAHLHTIRQTVPFKLLTEETGVE